VRRHVLPHGARSLSPYWNSLERRLLIVALLGGVSAMGCFGFDPQGWSGESEGPCSAQAFRLERHRMVEEQIRTRGVSSPSVLEALRTVPRHCFVPAAFRAEAYDDHPLPIGMGQTISQPYIVGLMTELLDLSPDDRVLEIGTGSGYQAAVLSRIVKEVYTVEIIPELAKEASRRLSELGYDNIHIRVGDGNEGWAEHAPYNAVIVTAAAPRVPPALIAQLSKGGRMCIPVGAGTFVQNLVVVTKDMQGVISTRPVIPVAFVPLKEGHGQEKKKGPLE